MVEKVVGKIADFEHTKDYMSFVNNKLQSKIQVQSARIMEPSPGRLFSEDPPMVAVLRCGAEPSGAPFATPTGACTPRLRSLTDL